MSGPLRHVLLGFRGALARPGLVVLHGALDLLGSVTALLPLVLALTLMASALVRTIPLVLMSFDPGLFGHAAIARVTSGSFFFPVLGLALSGALLTGVLRVFFLSGAIGVLAEDMKGRAQKTTFMDNASARFPSGLGAAVLIFFVGLLWVAWSMGMLWSAATIYASSLDGITGVGGAAALALSMAALILFAIAFEIVTRLTLIRVFLLGEGPAVAVFEAVSLMLRRLGAIIVLVLVFALVQIVVAVALFGMTVPMASVAVQAADSGWLTAARVVSWIIRALAMALPALAAYGAYSALVLDDAGELPAPSPPDPGREQAAVGPQEPVAIARPMEPVVVAVPLVEARPIEEGEA